MSDEEAPDVLGLDPGSGSPVTAKEDSVLDKPGGFSRAPGVGRPITGSGAGSFAMDYRTHHRGIDAQKKTMDPEVPQMKIEDQSFKFDFHVISSKCF